MSPHTIPTHCLVPVTDEYECGICLETTLQPADTQCGHVFCVECLKRSTLENKDVCPQDRLKIVKPGKQIVVSSQLAAMIGRKSARCPNDSGAKNDMLCVCEWVGVVSKVKEHLKECPMETVKCPLGCGAEMPGDKVRQHTKDQCTNRTIECDNCGEKMAQAELVKHKGGPFDCKGWVACERGCTVSVDTDFVKVATSEQHRKLLCAISDGSMNTYTFPLPNTASARQKHEKVCPLWVLTCKICAAKFNRCDAEKHRKNYTTTHMNKLFSRITELEREVKRLKPNNNTTSRVKPYPRPAAPSTFSSILADSDYDTEAENLISQPR